MNEYENYTSPDHSGYDDWVDFYIKQQKEDKMLNEVKYAIVEIGEWIYV